MKSAQDCVKHLLEDDLPDEPEEHEIGDDPSSDVWRCPACGKINAPGWNTAEEVAAQTGEEVKVSHGSCFDNICGHCGRNFVRADSPIRAEVYTHEPQEPIEEPPTENAHSWRCSACQTLNFDGDACRKCETPKKRRTSRRVAQAHAAPHKMNAPALVSQLLEDGPDDIDPKDELMKLPPPETWGGDYSVENHGSICLIRPLHTKMAEWLRETAPEEAQFMGNALVVEPRYVGGVIDAIQSDGWLSDNEV